MNVKKTIRNIIIFITFAIVIFGLGQCCGMRTADQANALDQQTYLDRVEELEGYKQQTDDIYREIEQLVDSLQTGNSGMEQQIDYLIELSNRINQAAGADTIEQNTNGSGPGGIPAGAIIGGVK